MATIFTRELIDNELVSVNYAFDSANQDIPIGVKFTFGAPIAETIEMFGEAIGVKHVYDGTPTGREGMPLLQAQQWLNHLSDEEAENAQLEGILIELMEDPLEGLYMPEKKTKKAPTAPGAYWDFYMKLGRFTGFNVPGQVHFRENINETMSGYPSILLTLGFQFLLYKTSSLGPMSEGTIYSFANFGDGNGFKPSSHGGNGWKRLDEYDEYSSELYEKLFYAAALTGSGGVGAVQYDSIPLGICRQIEGVGAEIRFNEPIKICERDTFQFNHDGISQEKLDYLSENFRLIVKLRGAGKKVGDSAFNSKCVVVYKNVEYGWDSNKLITNSGHIQIGGIDFNCSTKDGAIEAAIELQKMARKSNNEQAYWIKGSI